MRIENQASPNRIRYMSGYVEDIKDNTIPLDLMILEYVDSLGKEKLLKHITELLGDVNE